MCRPHPRHNTDAEVSVNSIVTPWEGPLFIVGMPRSGTKLLRGLLTQHELVRIPPIETEFLPFIASWVERHGAPTTEPAFKQLYDSLRAATYFDYRGRVAPAFEWASWRVACA